MSFKDQNKLFIVTSLITFVMIVFTFYITVFDQIISQNQGFFYAIVFGVVLVLAFVLCNLFTKLLAISSNLNSSKIFRIISISCFCLVSLIFIALRFRYNSTLSTYDSDLIKCASSFANGGISGKNELISMVRRNPTDLLYALLLTPIIKFMGESTGAIMTINAIFMILTALFAYRTVQLISDRICALIAAFGCLLIPGQSFAVYSFDSDVLLSMLVFLSMDLYIHFWYLGDDVDDKIRYIYVVGCGLAMGLVIVSEPAMIIAVALMFVAVFLLKKRELKNILISSACSLGVVVICILIKSFIVNISIVDSFFDFANSFTGIFTGSDLGISPTQIFDSFISGISNQNYYINDSYYFLYGNNGAAYSQLNAAWLCLINQIIYMFVLVMGMMCMIYSIRGSYIQVLPVNIMFMGSFIALLFQAMRNQSTFPFVSLLIVLASICLNYMYLNHHPELDDVSQYINSISEGVETIEDEEGNVEVMSESAFVDRAKALIFVGENDKLYQSIKEQEIEKAKKEFPDRLPEVPKADEVIDSKLPEKEPYFFDSEDKKEEFAEEPDTSMDDFDENSTEDELSKNESAHSGLSETSRDIKNALLMIQEENNLNRVSSIDENDILASEDESNEDSSKSAVEDLKEEIKEEINEEINEEIKEEQKEVPKESIMEELHEDSEEQPKEESKDNTIEATQENSQENTDKPELEPIHVEKFIRDDEPAESVDESVESVDKSIENTDVAGNIGKPLHNPLPTPKKHEHKTIDFDYKNDKDNDDGWEFDYEVADDDDWDYD